MRIGWVLCGSFCTLAKAAEQMKHMVAAGHEITPIFSTAMSSTDTRFGTAAHWHETFSGIAGRSPLTTLVDVEPIGPKGLFDILVVAPCTGATIGKLANGISDTPATLAVKSHLRRGRPVVLAVSTNDALGASMRGLALLKNTRHFFLVPMRQDDVEQKPNSLVADFSRLEATVLAATDNRQIQPLWL